MISPLETTTIKNSKKLLNKIMYNDFLTNLINNKKFPKDIFNPLKFESQFLQSIYIFEEYLKEDFKKKVKLIDLFAGIGIYAIFFAKFYRNSITKIYATEKDKRSYDFMVNLINLYNYQDLIIPCKVKKDAGYNPYLCREIINKDIKFDLFIANPPYVPIPQNKKHFFWGNGGPLGITGIIEFLKGVNKFASKRALFGCLSYSLGSAEVEKGSIITANLPFNFNINSEFNNEYRNYQKLINNLLSEWKLKFFVLNPSAWIAYDRNAKDIAIPLKRYYSFIFPNVNSKISNYIQSFNKDYRFLNNIFIIGMRDNQDYHSKIILKNVDSSYLSEVIRLEEECWPKYLQASKSNIHSRLKYFPEGCIGAFGTKGNLVGFSTSQRIFFLPYPEIKLRKLEKWMELDNLPDSNIKETYNQEGNALHLVSACVLPKYRSKGVWNDMIIHRLRLAKLLDLDYVVILSRLNFPHKKVELNELFNYIETFNDPYLKVLRKYNFLFNGVIRKTQDFESGGYWVILFKKLKNNENEVDKYAKRKG